MLFGPEAWVYIASLLLSYFTLARQSNVFSFSPLQLVRLEQQGTSQT